MSIRRTIITAATALTVAALLAGCSGTSGPKTTSAAAASHTPTASATPSPTSTVAMAPALAPIPAPTSKDDALQSASTAVSGFYKAYFNVNADPSLGVHYLDNFIITDGLTTKGTEAWNVATGIRTYAANKWHSTGSPTVFEPNMTLSYVTDITVNGVKVPHGGVVILGCGTVTGRKVVASAGGKPVPSEYQQNGSFAGEVDLYYLPQFKGWRVKFAGPVQQNNATPTC